MSGDVFDFSEVRKLAVDLQSEVSRTSGKVRPIFQKAALNIKNQLRDEAKNAASYKHFSRSITYDTTETAKSISAEIGPDKNKTQGALGNILYFGTSKNAPVLPDPQGALDREAPNLEKWLTDLANGLL